MAIVNQIIGGGFQDSEGNLLANGYLQLQLNQDETVNTSTLICSGLVITVPLDVNGNIVTSPAYSFWPNDLISPSGSFYTVTAFTQSGERVWGPNSQQILSSPSPFDVGAWVPNA